MTGGARIMAAIAGASVIAFSFGIYLIASSARDLEPPDPIDRALASAVLLAVPGIIGLIGASTERRTVLVAAGVLCILESATSFSGVTLVYLLPAMALLRSATQGSDAPARPPVRPIRLLIAAALAIPLSLLIVFKVGVLGVLALAVVAGLASSRSRGQGLPAITAGAAARGAAIVLLVIGAWAVSFVLVETTCWIGRAAPDGGIAWERIPPTDTLTLGPDDVASTCAEGTITPLGIGVAGGILVAALGVAALPLPAATFSAPIRSRPGPP